jgi:putative hemolysin
MLFVSCFFSISETALISLPKSRVDALVNAKTKNSRILHKLKTNPQKILITVLIGNNLANVAASTYAAILFSKIFASNALGISTGVMTMLLLVFGEITPKAFAHQYAEILSLIVAWPIYVLEVILFPLVWIFENLFKVVNHLIGGKKPLTVTEGEVLAMLKIGAKEGSIEKHEREFIENVFEFNDIQVQDVMTPRVAVDALDSRTTIDEAVDFVGKHSHTRIPVYEKDLDHIIGVISVKDLLAYFDKYSQSKKLKNLKLVKPLEVPYTKKINHLFREMKKRHVHMGVVIDEFGGTAGIVTMEDLLEEIVGEIADEHDQEEAPIEVLDNNTIIIKGSMLVEDVNDFFRVKFSDKEKDPINTLLVEHLQRFPREGEVVRFPMGKILVLQVKNNVVQKVKITKFSKKRR